MRICWRFDIVAGCVNLLPLLIHNRGVNTELINQMLLFCVSDNVFNFGVCSHVGQTLDWIFRIQRHVSGTGLQDADQHGR